MHRPDDLAIGKSVISLEGDHSDLHLRAFIDCENQLDSIGRRNLFVGRPYHGELMAMLRFEVLDRNFGFFDFCGVKLSLD